MPIIDTLMGLSTNHMTVLAVIWLEMSPSSGAWRQGLDNLFRYEGFGVAPDANCGAQSRNKWFELADLAGLRLVVRASKQ